MEKKKDGRSRGSGWNTWRSSHWVLKERIKAVERYLEDLKAGERLLYGGRAHVRKERI